MTDTRIYHVTEHTSSDGMRRHHLIEATSGAQAIRFVASGTYSAKIPSTKEIAHLMAAEGVKVQKATNGQEATTKEQT